MRPLVVSITKGARPNALPSFPPVSFHNHACSRPIRRIVLGLRRSIGRASSHEEGHRQHTSETNVIGKDLTPSTALNSEALPVRPLAGSTPQTTSPTPRALGENSSSSNSSQHCALFTPARSELK